MTEQLLKEENLRIFKEIERNPSATQRAISLKLGISLGKTNYLFKELIKKGLIKAKSFSGNASKLKTINYILTKEGLKTKIDLLNHFLTIKEREYYQLKQECEAIP